MSQKSREYWEKRARENENKVYKQGTELVKELNSSYIRARREIQKSINDLVARYMDKTNLSYAEAVKNLTSSEFKEWRMGLEEYEKEIERLSKFSPTLSKLLRIELETLATKSQITRLDILKAQIDFELNKKGVTEQEIIEKGIGTVYKDFYKMYTTEFGLTGINTVLPKKTVERLMRQPWSGANFSERIWNNREALGNTLKQEIIQSFMQGISVKDLSDRIQKRFEADKYNTERLVRTELNYALNETTRLSYEEAEIGEYEFLAEIDNRTSKQCRELNGQKFKLKDAKVGINYPPMHPHCRSTTVPVIDYESIGKKKEKKKVIKNDTIKEKDELDGLNQKLPRKKFAEKLLSNLELNHLEVTVKEMSARGSCGLGFEPMDSQKSKLIVKTYNLEKKDNRKKYYQLKTVFHEAYHALGHNKEVDFVLPEHYFQEWAYIDDVFAECSAHYMMKRMDNKIPISPSYPDYLVKTLPKLKKLEKFKNCKTIEDFGEIAWKDKMAGKNPTWITLKKELDKINIDEDYYKKYLEYARSNKSKIHTLIKRNSPNTNIKQIERGVEKALKSERADDRISQLIIANVMKLKGVM